MVGSESARLVGEGGGASELLASQHPPRPPAFTLESQKTGARVHIGHQGCLLTLLRMRHINAALLLALGYI